MKNIYRKSMLDKLSSPEQLDRLIVIARPSAWIALLGGLLVVVCLIIWAFVGTLPETVTAQGVYISSNADAEIQNEATGAENSADDKMVIYCYVPVSSSGRIEEGMEVNIYPATDDENDYGHIIGKVTDVSEKILTEEEISQQVQNEPLAQSIFNNSTGTVICVTCVPEEDESSPDGYKWAGKQSASLSLSEGTPVSVEISTDAKHPIEMLFPEL